MNSCYLLAFLTTVGGQIICTRYHQVKFKGKSKMMRDTQIILVMCVVFSQITKGLLRRNMKSIHKGSWCYR